MGKKADEKSDSIQAIKDAKRTELLRQKLSNPIRYKWPPLTDEVDHQIQLRLQRAFEPYKKCLRRVKKKPPWAIHHWTANAPPLSQQEEEDKTNFKKLFCLGVSNVLKCLERDKLRLVLIWKATQPAELKKAVLSLVASTGCLAASISDVLHPVKASFEALSSLTAIGIMKSSSPNVFDDMVQFVKSEVPRIEIPELPRTNTDKTEVYSDTDEKPSTSAASQKLEEHEDVVSNFSNISNVDKNEVSSKSRRSLKRKAEKKAIDWFKYDINKDEKTGFGDDFIKFSEEGSSKLVEIDEENINPHISFGIAAPLSITSDSAVKQDIGEDKKTGKKRKLDKSKPVGASGYKEISIKHFNSNPNKKKKKKFKMKKTK